MSRKSRKNGLGKSAQRQRRKLGEGFLQGRHLVLECLEERRLLSLNPIISEVDPGNKTGIVDALGNNADWLEIYNPDPTTAVNLSGWTVSYEKTGDTTSKTWTFANNVVLGPGEFRVIFCDSSDTSPNTEDAVGELDTGFNLSKAGATVELINTSSAVISSLTYPALSSDTSYGLAETVTETDLVAAGATATYYAPTNNSLGTTWTQSGFNDSSWASGPTGLGFANIVPGFATTLYQANTGVVSSVAQAEAVISTPSEQTSVTNETESVLNFMDTGGGGHFGNDNPFPGMTVGEGGQYYVLQATGTLQISASQAGYYTFGANTDDGFTLTISGADFTTLTNATNSSGSDVMTYDGLRGASDTLGTTYLAAGSYPINLVYFQNQGGASMEFFAAKESSAAGVTSFDATNSHLVGDTADGGLAVSSAPFNGTASNSGPFAAAIATNVKPAIQAAIAAAGGTSLYTRIAFNAANYASLSSLTLKMQYDDGYVAYLNGVEIASENAPSSPTWNSWANEEQTSDVQATTYENVDVSSFLNSATVGHLTATGNVLAIQVLMSSATDTDMLVVPELAQMTSAIGGDHIFSTPTPGAANALGDAQPDVTFSTVHGFFYAPFQVTLTPDIPGASIYYTTDNSAPSATNGTLYTKPITITTTTVLQAAMVVGSNAGAYQTETYVFPDAVANQPAAPAGFPTVWNGTINGEDVAADYAMSPVPGYTVQQVINALSALPTMSIVTSNANMFGPSGIYSNSDNHNLEVPGSFEYFNPLAGTTDFGSLAGLSMYGGVGRDPQFLKHGFQISFDQSGGASLMNENIFGDGYLPDGLVLRQAFNDGWSWGGASTQFIIDQWTRNALTALGTQNTPGIWVQLFVNGLYWGMYNAVADIDSAYAAYFFGGQKSDYDVYHYSSDGFEVKSGSMTGWNDMFNVARYGNVAGTGTTSPTVLANPTAYALMATYLNLPDFCDYIITNYYGANWDWDWHNYSAFYSTTAGTGFIFQDWDGEGMLLNAADGSPYTSITNRDTQGDPTELFVQLLANPDFRQMFADHVYKDLTTALSPANSAAMYQALANTISQGVIDESARWGNLGELDGTWDELGTPATWEAQLNVELGSFFPTRTATMFSQFATAVTFSPQPEGGTVTYTMYPSFAPPTLRVNGTVENGGAFLPGAVVTMTMAAPAGAIIYYTTDGSDPRAGSADFAVSSITLSGTTATVTLNGASTALLNGEEIYIGGAAQSQYDGEFAIGNVTVNSAAGTTTFTYTVTGSPASPATPLAGESLVASTLGSGGLSATAIKYTGAITLTQGEEINARVLSGKTWSALNASAFYVNLAPSIRVTEVMYDPAPATQTEVNNGYVVSDTTNPNRDFQYIEIENIGTQTLPLGGLQISGGITFTFPEDVGTTSTLLTLAPDSYMVAVADLSAFTIRYGAELQAQFGSNWQNLIVAGQFSAHHLNDVSDEVALSEPTGG
ncbi:MAG: lamin tail domain-containing protein, partial [Thermoguttaceae bacterium]